MTFEKIEQFKNLHEDKRLFILASGPSLAELDLSHLKNKMVMGLNRSFMIYPNTHYHCVMDLRLFDLFGKELKQSRYLFTLENRPFGVPLKLLGSEGFSFDLTKGIYTGYTITYVALQIAVYMGFKQVFVLGLDLKHKGYNTHFFGNDFHSAGYEQSEFVKMKTMLEKGAKEARDHGVELYNCSTYSNIKGFKKVEYEWTLQQ